MNDLSGGVRVYLFSDVHSNRSLVTCSLMLFAMTDAQRHQLFEEHNDRRVTCMGFNEATGIPLAQT